MRQQSITIPADKISRYSQEAEAVWGKAYKFFSTIIEDKALKVGVEVGVAYGGHAEAILSNTTIDRLYGVDPYQHIDGYRDPMNLPQAKFDQLYDFMLNRLARFGDRYNHIRKFSRHAVNDVHGQIDFVYIDADHSYKGVWEDLCSWYPKVRTGGVIGGHDYDHPSFPGVTQAVIEFFRRFDWEICTEGEGVWWVEKQVLNISFFMPAYNCAGTVQKSVESIMEGNFSQGDELIIVNDGSTDNTETVLQEFKAKYPEIKILKHTRNKGGGAARNTAIENCQHPLLFCLDSDNILTPGSITRLKAYLLDSGADVAAFQALHYFRDDKSKVTHKWVFKPGVITLADCLAGSTPGASGNYMFTRKSWMRAGGYPEFAGALDAWGFGFRQLVTGSKMMVMPDSYYYHRYGYESYWIREAKKGQISLTALQIMLPFLDLLEQKDVDYIMSPEGQDIWFDNLRKRPLKVKNSDYGISGKIIHQRKKSVKRKGVSKYIPAKLRPLAQNLRLLQRHWLDPVFPIHKSVTFVGLYAQYWTDWKCYRNLPGAESLHIGDSLPCLFDRTVTTSYDPHYFYQDIWAFKRIQTSGTPTHIDVGSRIILVGMLTAITNVTFIDIRPLMVSLDKFNSQPASILSLPFANNSISSFSCLHVAEHIGLGRYGDPLEPRGTKKATRELARVLAPGGNLYFSVPIGKPRVQFNAHRIHSPQQILDYFYDLQLVHFSAVDDRKNFCEDADPDDFSAAKYSCGLFHFRKQIP